MDKIITQRNMPLPDIEVTDDVGKLQFFNLSGRQHSALVKYKRIQQLVKLIKNDQALGAAVREVLEFGYDENEE
jgi:hypothetical protein